MRIAIIGAGISGLTAAYYLSRSHEVSVFEESPRCGGHTHTVTVEHDGQTYPVDTGFIVYNDRTYPHFIRLLDELGVRGQPTEMSFSMRDERSGWEYRGADLSGFFAQRRNLFRLRSYRLLYELWRFNRVAVRFMETGEEMTVREFFAREKFSRELIEQYFLPMASAVWSCPRGQVEAFPIRFVLEFYRHHGLLSLHDRPRWQVIRGGSRTYLEPLTRSFRERLHLNAAVCSIERGSRQTTLTFQNGQQATFDWVVFACHSDQALRILGQAATPTERELLSAFPYEENDVVLHTDTSILPRAGRAWAAWNYFAPAEDRGKATVTYYMNKLQSLAAPVDFCVTLNATERIDPAKILRRMTYHHPVFTLQRAAAQKRHHELLLSNRTSYCGAYWRHGFHEDGVVSALTVCRAIEGSGDLCNLASTKDGCDIGDKRQWPTAFDIASS